MHLSHTHVRTGRHTTPSSLVPSFLQSKGVDLSSLRNCITISEERPRHSLLMSFAHLFSQLGLSQRAVSASFSCKVNSGVCLQVSGGKGGRGKGGWVVIMTQTLSYKQAAVVACLVLCR